MDDRGGQWGDNGGTTGERRGDDRGTVTAEDTIKQLWTGNNPERGSVQQAQRETWLTPGQLSTSNPRTGTAGCDSTGVSHLEQDKELKDSPERWREEACIGDGHLEKQSVEEAVPDVDQGVLVHVGVSDPVGSHVVVDWNVVIWLVLRHDLQRAAQTAHAHS